MALWLPCEGELITTAGPMHSRKEYGARDEFLRAQETGLSKIPGGLLPV